MNAEPTPARTDGRRALSAEAWDWQLRARCRGMPAGVFFSTETELGRRRREHQENAKRICRSCPVLGECRDYAIAAGEPYGIWGALTPQERGMRRRAAG